MRFTTLLVLLLASVFSACSIEAKAEVIENSTLCAQVNGIWIEEVKECEDVTKASCERIGGEFNPCGYACKNDPDAKFCTLECVPYCSLE